MGLARRLARYMLPFQLCSQSGKLRFRDIVFAGVVVIGGAISVLLIGIWCNMPTYPPPSLNDQQLMLAQLLALEKPIEEVADIVGVSVQYVRIMKKNNLFLSKVKDEKDKYLDSLRLAARIKVVEMVSDAVDTVHTIMRCSDDERVKLQAASKLIDQAELLDKKLKVSEERRVSVTISPEKTKLIQAVIAEDDDTGTVE